MPERLILLVEDDADDEELTLRALREAGVAHEVVVVHDGAEALEVLGATGEPAARVPQLVLLDLKLPKLGGLEVLQRLRSDPRAAPVPVVVLTSSSEEDDIVASYRLGANSFVRKPVEFPRFAEAVRQIGAYWLLLNEPLPARRP